ncbi:hypothetical protein BDW22DRAFT_1426896 [Trametopsis cervina]|nr:hypothetical protein BDW22DRAFT_1426896 [Trametopsis cervina]
MSTTFLGMFPNPARRVFVSGLFMGVGVKQEAPRMVEEDIEEVEDRMVLDEDLDDVSEASSPISPQVFDNSNEVSNIINEVAQVADTEQEQDSEQESHSESHKAEDQSLEDRLALENLLLRTLSTLVSTKSEAEADKRALMNEVVGLRREKRALEGMLGEVRGALEREMEKKDAQKDARVECSIQLDSEVVAEESEELADDEEESEDEDEEDEPSFSFSTSTFELELEREMYKSQEQEALAALDTAQQSLAVSSAALATETALRITAQTSLSAVEQSLAATEQEAEQHRTALRAAELHTASLATRLGAALARVEKLGDELRGEREVNVDLTAANAELTSRVSTLTSRISTLYSSNASLTAANTDLLASHEQLTADRSTLSDANAAVASQLHTECDAHADTRADFEALQVRHVNAVRERDSLRSQLLSQTSQKHRRGWSAGGSGREETGKGEEKMVRELKKQCEVLGAALVEAVARCEGKERELLRFQVSATEVAVLAPQVLGDAGNAMGEKGNGEKGNAKARKPKQVLCDKENAPMQVASVSSPLYTHPSSVYAFDDPSAPLPTCNGTSTPPLPGAFEHTRSPNGFFKYFMRRSSVTEFPGDNFGARVLSPSLA